MAAYESHRQTEAAIQEINTTFDALTVLVNQRKEVLLGDLDRYEAEERERMQAEEARALERWRDIVSMTAIVEHLSQLAHENHPQAAEALPRAQARLRELTDAVPVRPVIVPEPPVFDLDAAFEESFARAGQLTYM